MSEEDKKLQAELNIKRINDLIRHIGYVQETAVLLGTKLISNGESDLGIKLIANAYKHDNSKFYGKEWEVLSNYKEIEPVKLQMMIDHHSMTNRHHPEYWGGIKHMPQLYLAEMVCDWAARSIEFKTGLREWIEKVARKNFKFYPKDKVYADIKKYVDLIVSESFQPIPEETK